MSLLLLLAGAPTTAPPSPVVVPTETPYAPQLVAGPVGLDPYRPWVTAVLDGNCFVVNGYDSPRRWDNAGNFYFAGSVVPTSGSAAQAAGGATFANGKTVRYYLVFCVSSLGKETAPQALTVTMSATRDIDITWTGSEPAADQDVVRIYRALDGTDSFHRVAQVAKATATYTDSTSDATLGVSGVAYVESSRTTLPPAFVGIAASQGRLFGWLADSEILHYSQVVRTDGRFVSDDFPNANLLPVGANEGTGAPTAFYPYYSTDIVWKRRAIYEKTGSDALTWAIRRLTNGRGTFNQRTVLPLDGRFLCLDEQGIYMWTPGVEPVIVGVPANTRQAPMQPIFDRLNLAASSLFHAVLYPAARIAVFYVALDNTPVPNVGIVFDYGLNRYVGLDTGRWSTAAGFLDDVYGSQHPCRGEDMGYLWEDEYRDSEGVFVGTTSATLTSVLGLTLTASAAGFDVTTVNGAPGAPLDRDTAAGVTVDENRVYEAQPTFLTLYYYPATTPAVGDTVMVGVIRGVVATGKMAMRSHELKKWDEVYLEFNTGGFGSTFFIDTAVDDGAFARQYEQTISTHVRAVFPLQDIGWTWAARITQRKPDSRFAIRAMHVTSRILPGQSLP